MNRHLSLLLFVGVAGALGLHVRPCLLTCPLGETAFGAAGDLHQGTDAGSHVEADASRYQDFVTYEDGNAVEQSMASVETALDAFVDELAREEKAGGASSVSTGAAGRYAPSKAMPAAAKTSTPTAARAASNVLRPGPARSVDASGSQTSSSRQRAVRPSFGELQLTR